MKWLKYILTVYKKVKKNLKNTKCNIDLIKNVYMRVCEWVRGALTSTVVGDALIHLPRKVNYPMAALVKKASYSHHCNIFVTSFWNIYYIFNLDSSSNNIGFT